MTVSSTTNKTTPVLTNGATVTFPFYFPVTDASQLRVYLTDVDTGDESLLTENDEYTVTLSGSPAGSSGGSITTTTTYPTGYKVTVFREVELTQDGDLDNQGGWFPEVHEALFDKVVMMVQQLQEQIDRCIKVPKTSTALSTELPLPEAGMLLGWDETGTELTNVTVSPDSSWVYDDFTGTGAQTAFALSGTPLSLATLDVSISGVTQLPETDYTLEDSTLTFTTAPGNTLPILVRYRVQ